MSATNLGDYIGRRGSIEQDGLEFEVEVTDARTAWGRVDLLVKPVAGTGTRWVQEASVSWPEMESA